MEDNKAKIVKSTENSIEIKASMNSKYAITDFKSKIGVKYVPWVDKKGKQFPEELMYLKNNSAMHGRILKSIVQESQGAGFSYDTSTLTSPQAFIEKKNSDGDNLYDVYCKCVDDEYTFGMSARLVSVDADLNIDEVQHIPMFYLRSAVVDAETQLIPGWFYYPGSWTEVKSTSNLIFLKSIDFANMNSAKKDMDLLYKNLYIDKLDNASKLANMFKTNKEVYVLINAPTRDMISPYYKSLPPYIGGLNAIRQDIQIDQYGINKLETGLNVDSVVVWKGDYTPEQKQTLVNDYNSQFRNADRGLQSVHIFAKDDAIKPEVIKLDMNGSNTTYTSINDVTVTKILEAHGVVLRSLYGIETAGSLGSQDELLVGSDLMYKRVIKPIQFNAIKPFNAILDYMGLDNISVDRINISDNQAPTK